MPEASATYFGEELVVEFTADLNHYEDGNEIENVEIENVCLLGIQIPFTVFPPEVQLAVKELSKEVEFTEAETDDYDFENDFDDEF